MRVLLVEDDDRFADALMTALRRHGYQVERARSGGEALAAGAAEVVLLDLGLPDMDGVDVLRQVRADSQIGIIVVTARGEEAQRVRGLRAGADDYIVKPFGIAELEARIEAVMRRVRSHRHAPAESACVGPLEVDHVRRSVCRDGVEIPLTRKEFDLLATLVRAEGAVVTRESLLAEVWHTTWGGTMRSLEVHVASLRAKLNEPGLIETVRGIGYRMRKS
ncbi:response regulator transcription factor [Streptosporangium sp. NPDC000396]|uniref:response regulator transcription factor n=1 Tax=Streptosporangium sp. NPDC000396 TaxID=3366185 RepID=UPI003688EC9F